MTVAAAEPSVERNEPASAIGEPASPSSEGSLRSRGFLALLGTQFLGALNDNMFRWLVVPIAQPVFGTGEALALGLACFTVPYLLLATLAGFLADRFSKRRIIIGCKIAEIGIMLAGLIAIAAGNLPLLFAVVALMGAQSALFSPARFGCIPEILKARHLSIGNGLMGLITVAASAVGVIAGYELFSRIGPSLTYLPITGDSGRMSLSGAPGWEALALPAACLVGIAVLGTLMSLAITRLPAANPSRRVSFNPVTDAWQSFRLLAGNTPLLRCALGIAFFWLLASLAQMNIDPYGDLVLGLEKEEIGPLLAILVGGVGLGSVLAGIWSRGHVELGIVPLGAAGIAVSSLLLFAAGNSVDPAVPATAQHSYYWSCLWLFLLGISAGLFNIPLEAFLQDRSETRNRGTILAASNFVSFSFILGASGLFYVMHTWLELSASEIFLVAGLGTIPVVIYIIRLLPLASFRFMVWLASLLVYRLRIYGQQNIPRTGGALLVANHVSFLDGVLMLLASSRSVRMIAYADFVEHPLVRWLTRMYGVIPIRPEDGPKSILRSLKTARQAIENGELVCIFAEGQITRTGQLQPFQRGLIRIIQGIEAPVIPVYLDGLWGSIFSFRGGRFFWKRPRRWPYPINILFGRPLAATDDINAARHGVELLGVEAVQKRKARQMVPVRRFLRSCRKSLFRSRVADSSGADLTGGKLLAGSLVLRGLIGKQLSDNEEMVGILLPPSVGGTLANTAVSLLRRVAVNLNYTLTNEDVNYCIRECGIKRVITSRRFLMQRPFDLDAELIYLEDIKEQVSGVNRAFAALLAYACPAWLLESFLGLRKIQPDDLLTVIFTSGSTGEPKGVMLTHHNVGSNINAVCELFHIDRHDVLMGVLPFFHSFGYTGTLWLVLAMEPKVVYHYNPLDSRTIGKMSQKHDATILLATPTFLRSYLKRCTTEHFHKLNLVIVGAEKMPLDLAKAFEEKFGIAPTEGYGTTELSPVAAFNLPASRAGHNHQSGEKPGTVGRVMPGAAAKVIHPDTGEDLGINAEGLLMISGPNVMKGYLNRDTQTAEVIRDGWYNTGDFARIDEQGFIEITGRQSRFSKIGGEMVPHLKIEEQLNRIVETPDDDDPAILLAVTAVPHPTKGERLIVVHRPLQKSIDEIHRELSDSNLPNLWIPSRDSFLEVESIPILGTGKLDLKGLKQVALEHFATEPATTAD